MEDAKRSNSIDLVLAVWGRQKWLAILIFGGMLAAVTTMAIFLPNVYRTSAKILIERQQIPEALVRSTVTSAVETRLQTISQEILSQSRLESLIAHLDLYPELREQAPPATTIERMRQSIRIELMQVEREGRDLASGTFTISFSASDPQQAALVTNAVASLYIEENSKIRERLVIGTSQFLDVQLEEVKEKLNAQEQRLSEFKERHLGDLPQQQEANLAALKQFAEQLRLNSDSQMRISERRAVLAKQQAEIEGFKAGDGPDATAARIAQLNQELTTLQSRFSRKYPDVIRLKSEIATLEEQSRNPKSAKNPENQRAAAPANPYVLQLRQAIHEMDLELKVMKADAERLRGSIDTYRWRVEQGPKRELEFQALSRDYDATKELYLSLLKRQGEAQLAENMEQRQKGEQFRILEPATASTTSAAPNRPRLVSMGLLLSLGMAAGVVVLVEYLDTSFHAVDDLRALSQIPVLVSIPHIVTATDTRRRRWRLCLGAVIAIVSLTLVVGSSYLVAQGKVPVVRDLVQLRLLRM